MPVNQPSISVNKLGEYVVSKAARQRKILHDRKYPDEEFQIGMYYREATEAISRYLASGALDQEPLETALKVLEQQTPQRVGTARRINGNIDAIERFSTMLDDVDFKGGVPELGQHAPPKLVRHGVAISVRPEIVLRATIKGREHVGAIKLHFSKTHPHSEESAGFVSAALNEFCKAHLIGATDAIVNPTFCQVIDVASGKVHQGVKSTKQRLADIDAACQNIAGLWPTI